MEGPGDAEQALSWAAHEGMKPPVALLIYPPDEPRRAVYFPLTIFSPEWQTLQWAASAKIPVRLMDLPETHQFAIQKAEEEQTRTEDEAHRPAGPGMLPSSPPRPSTENATAAASRRTLNARAGSPKLKPPRPGFLGPIRG